MCARVCVCVPTYIHTYGKINQSLSFNACRHSYLHLNISRSALFNNSHAGSFPASLITNCTKSTAQYIFLYASF